MLSSYFGSPRESWLHINVVINWQLSKQGIRWPVSPDRIAGSGIDPSRSSIFWSYPLTIYWFSNDRRLTLTFFKIHIKYVVFVSVSPRPITIFRRKNSGSFFKIQAGKTFSNHGHVLVTLHVQFLCSDWLKFDRCCSCVKCMQHLESCLLWQLKLTEFWVNLWCF